MFQIIYINNQSNNQTDIIDKHSITKPFVFDNNNVKKDIIVKNNDVKNDDYHFPIPPSTSETKSLSPEFKKDMSIINNVSLDSDPLIQIRNSRDTKESHYPKYYRKDNLSGNTIGTSELHFVGDENKSYTSWSDQNVSQYPKYYTSNFKGGLTNPGLFFDQNNQYTDLTGPRSEATIDQVCYNSKEGEQVCLKNDHLQNIPPSLISDVNNCAFLNSIGLLNYSNQINHNDEKIFNGGVFYNNVTGSKKNNEEYSQPIKQPTLDCKI